MNKKIAIISNVNSLDLYSASRSFYESLPYDKIPVIHSHAFDFLNHVITDPNFSSIDVMVYVDVDCFITDTVALSDLIKFFCESNFVAAGMPDGGVVKIRSHNPVSINQFFCILDLSEIRKKYDLSEVLSTKYDEDLVKFTPSHLMRTAFKYDDYESYYKLFFWMIRQGFPVLYLDAHQYEGDNTTTILHNHNDLPFAYHSWYGRNWEEASHHSRIQSVIDHCQKIKVG